MKTLLRYPFALALFAVLLGALLLHAFAFQDPEPAFLTDSTGSLFRPTNKIARTLGALEAASIRGGSTPINSGETTKAIVFNQPMQDATYIVLATPSGATTVSIPVASKTTNGFTLNLTTGINGRVDWLAINPQ